MKEFLVPITALWVDSSLAIVLCTLFFKKKKDFSLFLFISFHTGLLLLLIPHIRKQIYISIYIYIIPSFHFTKQFRDSICHQCELARTTFSFLKKNKLQGHVVSVRTGLPLFVCQLCTNLCTAYAIQTLLLLLSCSDFLSCLQRRRGTCSWFFFQFFFFVVCLYLTSLSWMHASYRLGGHKTQGRK